MDAGASPAATPSYGLEVLPVPVTDVDRAVAFYADLLGFHVDVDYPPTPEFRVVQLTPRGSAASIQVGVGVTTAVPGSLQGLTLVVADLVGTHELLTERGVAVGAIRHKASVEDWRGDFEPGPDPAHRDYASFTDLTDPDGNTWVLQERGYDAAR